MSYITLREWNARQLRPRSMEQVRRWVRTGKLYPPPFLDGREYLIQANAVKINPTQPKEFVSDNSRLLLLDRIKKSNRR